MHDLGDTFHPEKSRSIQDVLLERMARSINLAMFGLGTVLGMYTAQNYDLPNLKSFVDMIGKKIMETEQLSRKK